jgi:hypothetical protein
VHTGTFHAASPASPSIPIRCGVIDGTGPEDTMRIDPTSTRAPSSPPDVLPPPAVSRPGRLPDPGVADDVGIFEPFAGPRASHARARVPQVQEPSGAEPSAPPPEAPSGEPGRAESHRSAEAQHADPPEALLSAPVDDLAPQYADALWVALLDAAPDADESRAETAALGAREGAASNSDSGGSAIADEVAVRLERIAARLRTNPDPEQWVGAADGDPLELLLAGVVLGYLRGRATTSAPTQP